MPHFSAAGNDLYLCQVCGRQFDSILEPAEWRPDITNSKVAGNVCPGCMKGHNSANDRFSGFRKVRLGMTQVEDAVPFLMEASEEDLRRLNELVVAAIRDRVRRKARKAMDEFKIGERVTWVGHGVRKVGTIVQFNERTVYCMVEGLKWRVDASLLRHI